MEVIMEYAVYGLIVAAIGAAFGGGFLVGRNNPNLTLSQVLQNAKDELARHQDEIDKIKADLLKAGVKL
jgi:hypothetical protein